MAGHMGHEQVTVKGLKVIIVDKEAGVLAVSGAVPGPKRGVVMVQEGYLMATATAYTKSGAKREAAVRLDAAVFGLEPNHELVGQASSHVSGQRPPSPQPVTLKRGDVRGGGKKPWRQKGTGRARAGSIRIPQWRGGGVVFGPTGA